MIGKVRHHVAGIEWIPRAAMRGTVLLLLTETGVVDGAGTSGGRRGDMVIGGSGGRSRGRLGPEPAHDVGAVVEKCKKSARFGTRHPKYYLL
jgi:hypothetical protein